MIILQQKLDAEWYFGVNSLPFINGNLRTKGMKNLKTYVKKRANRSVETTCIELVCPDYVIIGPEEFFL